MRRHLFCSMTSRGADRAAFAQGIGCNERVSDRRQRYFTCPEERVPMVLLSTRA